jgi:hypothetical protein
MNALTEARVVRPRAVSLRLWTRWSPSAALSSKWMPQRCSHVNGRWRHPTCTYRGVDKPVQALCSLWKG